MNALFNQGNSSENLPPAGKTDYLVQLPVVFLPCVTFDEPLYLFLLQVFVKRGNCEMII